MTWLEEIGDDISPGGSLHSIVATGPYGVKVVWEQWQRAASQTLGPQPTLRELAALQGEPLRGEGLAYRAEYGEFVAPVLVAFGQHTHAWDETQRRRALAKMSFLMLIELMHRLDELPREDLLAALRGEDNGAHDTYMVISDELIDAIMVLEDRQPPWIPDDRWEGMVAVRDWIDECDAAPLIPGIPHVGEEPR